MSQSETAKKFSRGRIVAPPAALDAIQAGGQTPDEFLSRHAACDWGDLDPKTRR